MLWIIAIDAIWYVLFITYCSVEGYYSSNNLITDKLDKIFSTECILLIISFIALVIATWIIVVKHKNKPTKEEEEIRFQNFYEGFLKWEEEKYGNEAEDKKERHRRIDEYYAYREEQNRKKREEIREAERKAQEESEAEQQKTYKKKEFLTKTEKEFIIKLKQIYEPNYIIQPQIPLRMIIEKELEFKGQYSNELNRYIDFGILDDDYNIKCLIELNDYTHNTYKREQRDSKVKEICKEANIPLLEIWDKNISADELKGEIDKVIYE